MGFFEDLFLRVGSAAVLWGPTRLLPCWVLLGVVLGQVSAMHEALGSV